MLNRLLLFIMALCLGSMLVRLHLPIPFLLDVGVNLLILLAKQHCQRHAARQHTHHAAFKALSRNFSRYEG